MPARVRGAAAVWVREWESRAGARAGWVTHRALGTSTGPRPLPPLGPASTSPPYFSSIPGLRSRRRCPRRGVSSCLAAAAEQRAQARHSPMIAGPVGSPQARPPPPLSRAPAHWHTRVGTRPRAVPAAPGYPEAHRSGRCQATSSGPAALTPGGVPSPAPAHNGALAFSCPSLGTAYHG